MSEADLDSAASGESVAVRIAGHEYKIRSDGDPDGLRDIARYVDQAMSRVRDRTRTVDTLDVAILTCLNLAREILVLRGERLPKGAATVDELRLRTLIEQVEETLGWLSEDSGAAETTVEQESPIAPPRTLDLPSRESLSERTGGHDSDNHSEELDEGLPEARMASGGRDRAS